jgi:arylsulfatase A-like enzyme
VYGGGILRGAPTPRIDKLASEGTRLLNFNVEAQCTPSRSALMTGRFSIRSGTYAVPIGGVADGLTQWEITIAELLSAQGYATGMWGKWHLGSAEERFPTHQGFDEWYGIPRTYDESMWPGQNATGGMWPSVGSKQGWNANIARLEPIYEARKGEKANQVGELNLDTRRTMEAEITKRAVDFIKRNASAGKPFYAYVSSSMVHMPALPNPEFVGKTGNGDWADCLAEMDYRTGQILDALKDAGVEDNTLVVFASDNGPEATDPWEGDSGPWRGTYFTAMEASLRAPFIIRWPGKVSAGWSPRLTVWRVRGPFRSISRPSYRSRSWLQPDRCLFSLVRSRGFVSSFQMPRYSPAAACYRFRGRHDGRRPFELGSPSQAELF